MSPEVIWTSPKGARHWRETAEPPVRPPTAGVDPLISATCGAAARCLEPALPHPALPLATRTAGLVDVGTQWGRGCPDSPGRTLQAGAGCARLDPHTPCADATAPDRIDESSFAWTSRVARVTSGTGCYHGDTEICQEYPGLDEDLYITADAEAFVKWHAGQASWAAAIRNRRIQLHGPSHSHPPHPPPHFAPSSSHSLVRAFSTWNARVDPAISRLSGPVSGPTARSGLGAGAQGVRAPRVSSAPATTASLKPARPQPIRRPVMPRALR